jgi:hypothetical protein
MLSEWGGGPTSVTGPHSISPLPGPAYIYSISIYQIGPTTLEFRSNAIFTVVKAQRIFHTNFYESLYPMSVQTYTHALLQWLNSYQTESSLRSPHGCHSVVLHSTHVKNCQRKIIFFSNISCHVKFQDSKLSVTSVSPAL